MLQPATSSGAASQDLSDIATRRSKSCFLDQLSPLLSGASALQAEEVKAITPLGEQKLPFADPVALSAQDDPGAAWCPASRRAGRRCSAAARC